MQPIVPTGAGKAHESLCQPGSDFHAIHSIAGAGGRYWGWRGLNPAGYIALVVGMTAAALTMRSPLFDGPIATALGGSDLSWRVGFPVSALVYASLRGAYDRVMPSSPHAPWRPEQGRAT